MELRQQIRDYIIEGKTDEALNLLRNQEGLPKSFHDEITLLQGRLKRLKNEKYQTLNNEQSSVELSEINRKILGLTNDITVDKKPSRFSKETLIPRTIPQSLMVLLISLEIAIGIFGELMPDTLKSSIEDPLGLYYLPIYLVVLGLTIVAFVWLSLRISKPIYRTPETDDFADESDNIRQKLLERYNKRLQSKIDYRLPIKPKLTYTKEGTSPDYLHFDKGIRVSQKLKGNLVDTLKKHCHLLIVGKPGAGKTTQLLELAKAWLGDSANEQIPVIFNLSAWKAEDRQLDDWLQATLVSGYGFSPSLAKEAIYKQQIIPLLDGLDEVGKDKADDTEQTRLRNQCLQAISQYLRLYNTPYLAICSRIKEFVTVGDAPVKAAILVNPLTPQAIKRTLKEALTEKRQVNDETAATTLLNLLPKHPVLEDILCTPFYYNIALDIFDDRTTRHDLPQEQAALELYLIEQFINKKLNTTDNPRHFTEERTRHSLAWVAHILNRENKINFELVDFQQRHLNDQILMGVVSGSIVGLVIALLFSLIMESAADLPIALSISLIFVFPACFVVGIGLSLLQGLGISPKEVRKVEWGNFMKLSTWIYALYGGFMFGLGFIVIFWLYINFRFGLVFGLSAGFTLGFITSLYEKVSVVTTFSTIKSPYYRLKSDVLFRIFWPTLLILTALSSGLFMLDCYEMENDLNQAIRGFMVSFSELLISNNAEYYSAKKIDRTTVLNSFVMQNIGKFLIAIFIIILPLFTSFFRHFMLRIALYKEKKMPLRWVSFFKYARSARILEQDGGQWRFRHQILQDYFAERYGKDVEKDSK